jgi:hypothetical protein
MICERVDYGMSSCAERNAIDGSDSLCFVCQRDAREMLRCLASNLAIAGGLARSFTLGRTYGFQSCGCGDPLSDDEWDDIDSRYFHPGCGRSAL